MDSKKTLIIGGVCLLVGIVLCLVFRVYVLQLLGGLIALGLLLAGALMVWMGAVDANETAANELREAEEAQRADEMAAKA